MDRSPFGDNGLFLLYAGGLTGPALQQEWLMTAKP